MRVYVWCIYLWTSTLEQALAGSRDSGILSQPKSRDFWNWNPGIFGIFCHYALDLLERSYAKNRRNCQRSCSLFIRVNPVPKNPGIPGFGKIPSRKIPGLKILIPLGPALDPDACMYDMYIYIWSSFPDLDACMIKECMMRISMISVPDVCMMHRCMMHNVHCTYPWSLSLVLMHARMHDACRSTPLYSCCCSSHWK